MGQSVKLGSGIGSGAITYPASVKGSWTVIHGNLSDTAETTALKRPATYGSAYVYPGQIHDAATRVLLMARYKQATSTVTTSPVVRLFAAYGPDASFTPSTGVFLDDGTVFFRRIDTATSTAAGVTFTLTTAATADKLRDTTYLYSDVYAIAGTDLIGAKWLVALTETAANISGGADSVVELLACVLN